MKTFEADELEECQDAKHQEHISTFYSKLFLCDVDELSKVEWENPILDRNS
jgi:hypothetical protein